MNYSRGNEINFKIVSPNIISFSPRKLFLSQPFIIFIVQEDILYLSSSFVHFIPSSHPFLFHLFSLIISFHPVTSPFLVSSSSSSHFIASPPLFFPSYSPPNISFSSRPNPFALSSYTHIPILSHPLTLSLSSSTGLSLHFLHSSVSFFLLPYHTLYISFQPSLSNSNIYLLFLSISFSFLIFPCIPFSFFSHIPVQCISFPSCSCTNPSLPVYPYIYNPLPRLYIPI